MVWILGCLVGSSRLERTMMEVMVGREMRRWRTAEPMSPVAPVRMIFMLGWLKL